MAANAVLSGTVSEIGGGKFANGAVTGAFAMMFNDMMHKILTYKKIKEIWKNYKETIYAHSQSDDFYQNYLGGEIGNEAKSNPQDYMNTCAARLSDALNKSGILLPYIEGQTYKDKHGYNVFYRASNMKDYLSRPDVWGMPQKAMKHWRIRNAVTFQDGFKGGVTGHVDVFCDGISGGAGYAYQLRKSITTYYW